MTGRKEEPNIPKDIGRKETGKVDISGEGGSAVEGGKVLVGGREKQSGIGGEGVLRGKGRLEGMEGRKEGLLGTEEKRGKEGLVVKGRREVQKGKQELYLRVEKETLKKESMEREEERKRLLKELS